MPLNGLSQINIELSSRCDKACSFCGHQDPEINKKLEYGDIDIDLLHEISCQVPSGIIVQFHRDGEPLVYPHLWTALFLFRHCIRSVVTNGKRLGKEAHEIVGRCESVTVSVFRGDPDGPQQLDSIREFLDFQAGMGISSPKVNIKIVGDLEPERRFQYRALGLPIIHRLLHVPEGSFGYIRGEPTVPEVGICLDFLSHPSIDWKGRMFVCNRLDPENRGYLGDLTLETLEELWNGKRRQAWLAAHIAGRRDLASPLCKDCEYWGVPTG